MTKKDKSERLGHMGERRCKAKSKQTGEQCKNWSAPGRKVCKHHGGASPRGKDHPRTTTGKYSKFLPDRLAERFESFLGDKDILELSAEIALVDSQIAACLERPEVPQSRWKTVRTIYSELVDAMDDGDSTEISKVMRKLLGAIEEGFTDAARWTLTLNLIEQRRKLTDSERRRVFDESNAVSIEQLMLLVARISSIVRENVQDERSRSAIGEGIRLLVHGRDA